MSGVQDAEEYFDLIVECAKQIAATPPPGVSTETQFYRMVREAWRGVYTCAAKPYNSPNGHIETLRRDDKVMAYAALARVAAMAAWWIGIQPEDGDDIPKSVADKFTKMAQGTPPRAW